MSQCFFPKTQQSTYSNTFIQGTASYIAPPSDSKTQPTTGHCLMTRVRGVATSLFIIVISPFEMLFNGAKFVGKILIGVVTINLEQIKNAWKKEGKETYIGFSRTILFPFVLIISAIHAKIWLTINESTNGKLTPAPLKGRTATASKEKSSYHPSRHHSKCSKIKELKENLAKAQTTATTIQSALQHRMLALEREKKELGDQLRAAQEEAREKFPVVPTIVVPQERIRELEAQLTQKTAALATAQTQAQENEREINKLKKIIEDKKVDAKTDRDLSEIHIQGLNQAIRNLELQIDSARITGEQLQQELNEKTIRIHELKTELDEREKEYFDSIRQQNEKIRELKEILPLLPIAPPSEHDTIKRLKDELERKTNELMETKREATDEKTALTEGHLKKLKTLSTQIVNLEAQINHHKAINNNTSKELTELKAALILEKQRIQTLRSELSTITEKQKNLEDQALNIYKALKKVILEFSKNDRHQLFERDLANIIRRKERLKTELENLPATVESNKKAPILENIDALNRAQQELSLEYETATQTQYTDEIARIDTLEKIPNNENVIDLIETTLRCLILRDQETNRTLLKNLSEKDQSIEELTTDLTKITEETTKMCQSVEQKLSIDSQIQKDFIRVYLSLQISKYSNMLRDNIQAKIEKKQKLEPLIENLQTKIHAIEDDEDAVKKRLISELEIVHSNLTFDNGFYDNEIKRLEDKISSLKNTLTKLDSPEEPLPISWENISAGLREVFDEFTRQRTQIANQQRDYEILQRELQDTRNRRTS